MYAYAMRAHACYVHACHVHVCDVHVCDIHVSMQRVCMIALPAYIYIYMQCAHINAKISCVSIISMHIYIFHFKPKMHILIITFLLKYCISKIPFW